MKTICDIWRYALASSEGINREDPLFKDKDITEFKEGNMGYGFGIKEPENNRMVVSFKGTMGNIKDWRRDFEFAPNSDGIHTGFAAEWAMFKDQVSIFVSAAISEGMDHVYFTGHSQGGATAIIASKAICDTFNRPTYCINFGTPAVGNREYRDKVNLSPIDCTNVINGYDIVPTLPPPIVGARQPGKPYWLKQPFWHALFCKIYDHFPENYDVAMKKII